MKEVYILLPSIKLFDVRMKVIHSLEKIFAKFEIELTAHNEK